MKQAKRYTYHDLFKTSIADRITSAAYRTMRFDDSTLPDDFRKAYESTTRVLRAMIGEKNHLLHDHIIVMLAVALCETFEAQDRLWVEAEQGSAEYKGKNLRAWHDRNKEGGV